MISSLPHRRTRLLLVAATLVTGLLAGGIVDRVIVGGPAWHELGASSWMQYSRRADLGTGLLIYPLEGIGATLLIISATLSNHFDRGASRGLALPMYCALVFSVIGMLMTVKAAPIMLALRSPQSEAVAQIAFEQFYLWGLYLRGLVDVLAFLANVWALSRLTAR
jgi:hypothetical protein